MVQSHQGERSDGRLTVLLCENTVKCLTVGSKTLYNPWLNGRGVEQSGSSSGS